MIQTTDPIQPTDSLSCTIHHADGTLEEITNMGDPTAEPAEEDLPMGDAESGVPVCEGPSDEVASLSLDDFAQTNQLIGSIVEEPSPARSPRTAADPASVQSEPSLRPEERDQVRNVATALLKEVEKFPVGERKQVLRSLAAACAPGGKNEKQ